MSSNDKPSRYRPKTADPAQEKAISDLLERLASSDAAPTEPSQQDESDAA